MLARGEMLSPWQEVKIRCHDLRVDFCTRAYEAEIPVKTLQAWMGHEDAMLIMEVYAKLTDERKKRTRGGSPNLWNHIRKKCRKVLG